MNPVKVMLASCAAALISTSTGYAADPTREEMQRVVKVPETSADHLALAKSYAGKATEWRQEAAYHRQMAAAYKQSHPSSKDSATMEKHCAKVARDAERLAKDAQTMADYHALRARELK